MRRVCCSLFAQTYVALAFGVLLVDPAETGLPVATSWPPSARRVQAPRSSVRLSKQGQTCSASTSATARTTIIGCASESER